MRKDGRSAIQVRPLRLIPNFNQNPDGSVLIETGETKVLCSVFVEEGVPNWMRNSKPARGWLTAEYSMLPGATNTRSRRERPQISGRTQEIQRLIGRSLRGVLDLSKIPDLSFMVDCDVIQADGGTRTASITGAYVALKLAIDKLIRQGRIKESPVREVVAAVSVGICNDEMLVDLNYIEDSSADLDMNLVMTQSGKIMEIQGTAEGAAFTGKQVSEIIDVATDALKNTFELQMVASEGTEVDG